MPRRPRFLIQETDPQYPEFVGNGVEIALTQGRERVKAGDLDGAFDVMETLYGTMKQRQPQGRRLHKGWPLHNMAMLRLQQGRGLEASHWFLCAFVEDVLSRGEESPSVYDELARPAAQNLLNVFNTASRLLTDLAERLRRRQGEGTLWQDPELVLLEEPFLPPVGAEAAAGEKRFARTVVDLVEPEWRRLDSLGTLWEDRVFVGGSYADDWLWSVRAIRDEVRRHGLDGVLVSEFRGGVLRPLEK